jgi:hypothetical protein
MVSDSEKDASKQDNVEQQLGLLLQRLTAIEQGQQESLAHQRSNHEFQKDVTQSIADLNRNMVITTTRLTTLENAKGLPPSPADLGASASASLATGMARLGGPGLLPMQKPPEQTSLDSPSNLIKSPVGSGVPRYYKLDFPLFDGKSDPLSWINRCEQFFRGQRTADTDKVWLATYHLTGVAQEWYYQRERNHGVPQWDEFTELCHLRFGPPIRSNPLGEIKQLVQTTTVEAYQEKFATLLCRTDALAEPHQVQLFVAGLSEDVRYDVEILKPTSLELAMSLARAYEKEHNRVGSNSRIPSRFIVPSRQQGALAPRSNTNVTQLTGQDVTPPRTFRKLTPAEMAERRRQGLCFNCDEKYVRGHHCSHLFYIEYDNEAADDEDSWQRAEESTEPVISLYAVTGITSGETMRLAVEIHGCRLIALVDSGSTHNFINEDVVQRLDLPVQPAHDGLKVMVANGDRLTSKGICRTLGLSIGNVKFDVDCYALSLGGFDVILGTQWLRALGPILWDFEKLTMSFWFGDRLVRFHGSRSAGATLHTITSTGPDLLLSLLADYEDLFVPPTGLPPKRFQDHRIRLHVGSTPVVVRPYRYPQIQKDEIERQCAEMSAQGIIQPSNSAFSSPVLLVPKHDKTSRFCVDFRALNAQTIKDKFPIPVVDELLDELKGSRFFTKLDLRSGYHQVRMHSDDVAKTAFRTHPLVEKRPLDPRK